MIAERYYYYYYYYYLIISSWLQSTKLINIWSG